MAPHVTVLLLSLLTLVLGPRLGVRAAPAEMHLHLFLHDVISGSNPTAVQIIKGATPTSSSAIPGLAFGDTSVIDDALTETPSATSASVGRAQGYYMVSSQTGAVLTVWVNLLLTAGDYNGSTLAVIGRDDIMATTRELSVVGGTGMFRMATGYVLWKTNATTGPDATIELDVYATTTVAAAAGMGGGATGKSSSVLPYGWAANTLVLVALASFFVM